MPTAILFSGSVALLVELAVWGNDLEMVSLLVVKSFCLAFTVEAGHVLTIALSNRQVPDLKAIVYDRSVCVQVQFLRSNCTSDSICACF